MLPSPDLLASPIFNAAELAMQQRITISKMDKSIPSPVIF